MTLPFVVLLTLSVFLVAAPSVWLPRAFPSVAANQRRVDIALALLVSAVVALMEWSTLSEVAFVRALPTALSHVITGSVVLAMCSFVRAEHANVGRTPEMVSPTGLARLRAGGTVHFGVALFALVLVLGARIAPMP